MITAISSKAVSAKRLKGVIGICDKDMWSPYEWEFSACLGSETAGSILQAR